MKVLRYTIVQDAGKAVYPEFVRGQWHGAAAQGIGMRQPLTTSPKLGDALAKAKATQREYSSRARVLLKWTPTAKP